MEHQSTIGDSHRGSSERWGPHGVPADAHSCPHMWCWPHHAQRLVGGCPDQRVSAPTVGELVFTKGVAHGNQHTCFISSSDISNGYIGLVPALNGILN